jgi:hypothetical protein
MATTRMQFAEPIDPHQPSMGRQHTMTTRRLQRLIGLCAILMTVFVLTAPSALAGPPETFTDTQHNASDTFRLDDATCPSPGLVTMNFFIVIHGTDHGDGRFYFHFSLTGDYLLVGDNGVTYTGHITQHFDVNQTTATVNQILRTEVILKGSDGSKVGAHGISHVTVNANGVTTTSFDHFVCQRA